MSDLISRQDAIEALIEAFADTKDGDEKIECGAYWYHGTVISTIKALPSAEARPTGEWVRLERDENVFDIYGVPTWGINYMCERCGFITTAIQDHIAQYKFCPSCGADMRGAEHEID